MYIVQRRIRHDTSMDMGVVQTDRYSDERQPDSTYFCGYSKGCSPRRRLNLVPGACDRAIELYQLAEGSPQHKQGEESTSARIKSVKDWSCSVERLILGDKIAKATWSSMVRRDEQ